MHPVNDPSPPRKVSTMQTASRQLVPMLYMYICAVAVVSTVGVQLFMGVMRDRDRVRVRVRVWVRVRDMDRGRARVRPTSP